MFQSKNLRAGEGDDADPLLDAIASAHILVVDDEPTICRLNAEVLIGAGYQVDVAGDGADAWEMLQSEGYDLLITDHGMRRMSGVELLLRLHASRRSLPTIMASGMMPTEELERYPWLQVGARLSKPYSITRLLGAVEEVLRATAATQRQMELPFYVPCQSPDGGMQQRRF
jgi:DNA-binding response OmpR family regulator